MATCPRLSAILPWCWVSDLPVEEFRTLNHCLDNGIAEGVSEFIQRRDVLIADGQALALSRRIGFFAHELAMREHGRPSRRSSRRHRRDGAAGAVLDRSLVGLRPLIDSRWPKYGSRQP